MQRQLVAEVAKVGWPDHLGSPGPFGRKATTHSCRSYQSWFFKGNWNSGFLVKIRFLKLGAVFWSPYHTVRSELAVRTLAAISIPVGGGQSGLTYVCCPALSCRRSTDVQRVALAEQRGWQKACKPCQTVVGDVILGLRQRSHFVLKLANRSLNFIWLVLVSQTRSRLGIILKVNTPLKWEGWNFTLLSFFSFSRSSITNINRSQLSRLFYGVWH